MIRVHRPPTVPLILATKGAAATAALCADYLAGTREFIFDRDIYGAAEVKEALKQAQHDKCCFCESKVSHISFGDVEHFRPKAAVRQIPGGSLRRPGYYWLAYE